VKPSFPESAEGCILGSAIGDGLGHNVVVMDAAVVRVDAAGAVAVAHSGMTHRHPFAPATCAAFMTGVSSILSGTSIPEMTAGIIAAARRFHDPAAGMLEQAVADAAKRKSPRFEILP
jgi:ADP-ribosylglycohydrolase